MQRLHYIRYAQCPKIAQLASVSIHIYADDHGRPHFHVRGADNNVKSRSKPAGDAGNYKAGRLAEAVGWAEANQPLLRAKWSELMSETEQCPDR